MHSCPLDIYIQVCILKSRSLQKDKRTTVAYLKKKEKKRTFFHPPFPPPVPRKFPTKYHLLYLLIIISSAYVNHHTILCSTRVPPYMKNDINNNSKIIHKFQYHHPNYILCYYRNHVLSNSPRGPSWRIHVRHSGCISDISWQGGLLCGSI